MRQEVKTEKLMKYGKKHGFNPIRGFLRGTIFNPDTYGIWYHRTGKGLLIQLGDTNIHAYNRMREMVDSGKAWDDTGKVINR